MSTITESDISSALTGDPEALEVHLELIEKAASIAGHSVKVHCHCLAVDANGKVQPSRLAEFMRNAVADYAIPRSKLAEAKARDAKYNSTEAVTALQYCGVALVGFDVSFYPAATAKALAADLAKACASELKSWKKQIGNRLSIEKLDQMEIEFFCIPLPSAEGFRAAFLKAMGIAEQ